MATAQRTHPPGNGDDRWSYAEQRLYARSPFNLWITTAILYAGLVGFYALAARIDRVAWIVRDKAGAALDHRAWVAICLALIACSTLCLQRYSRLMEIKDIPDFALALGGEAAFGRPLRRPDCASSPSRGWSSPPPRWCGSCRAEEAARPRRP